MRKINWINGKITKTLEKEVLSVIDELEAKLGIKLDFIIQVRFHKSRTSYEKQLEKHNTQNWEVGNTSENNEIDIFHPDVFEDESSHKREDFLKILKHEITHIYIKKLANSKAVPMWLNEGLAMYLAGQVKQYRNKTGLYIETEYASKLSSPSGWNKYADHDAYRFACLFVNFLVTKYGLEPIIRLIKSIPQNYYRSSFEKIFNEIFKTTIAEAEEKFVNETNS